MKTIDCEYFRENIKNIIQNSGLNIGTVYFIMKDLCNELENSYYNQVNFEAQKLQEETQKAKEAVEEVAKETE
jgi:predicted house-cleaning noncanonical NTP pyrophosphatase (MazG superfamily)